MEMCLEATERLLHDPVAQDRAGGQRFSDHAQITQLVRTAGTFYVLAVSSRST
jgi:hypothetical protein